MNFVEIVIPCTEKKQKLSCYLYKIGYGRSFIKSLSTEPGLIFKNGKSCFLSEIVKEGDVFKLAITNDTCPTQVLEVEKPINILFEDDNFLLIDKPRGLATMPTRSHYCDNLVGRIAHYYKSKGLQEKVRILTRLDKEVCGVVLVAKTLFVCNYFAKHKEGLEKTYLAKLKGNLRSEVAITAKIKTTINENGIINKKRIISDDGKDSLTYFYPIEYDEESDCTRVRVVLGTGRTHQIRLHSSHIGHSIVGDDLYGEKADEKLQLLCHSLKISCPPLNFVKTVSTNFKLD